MNEQVTCSMSFPLPGLQTLRKIGVCIFLAFQCGDETVCEGHLDHVLPFSVMKHVQFCISKSSYFPGDKERN